MDAKELSKIQRRIKVLQKQLGSLGPVMRGSVVRLGQKQQICFSLNKDKKTQLIYLGKKRESKAREYSDNYKKLVEIVEEMTQLNMLLLKKDYGIELK